ncbi:hypothetical protein [Halorubrum vacuolatum]|uniref:Uncharacterized protein n=1 Tax=Halorubrum vacuolatum TaxID=63740 RepID=A0A238UXM7_HALVU|nr:hypothetical protein [Halorubrum vacuolatum]SNR26019.1 hypothetical protein SAMN06264855_101434 [Halorubrum vacuolatum]
MNRRTLLAGTAVALAGCTARGEQPDGSDAGDGSGIDAVDDAADGSSDVEDRDIDNHGIDDDLTIDLGKTAPEMAPGAVDVAVDADELHIDGTVTGATGCHVPAVETATVEGDELQLVVIAVSDAAPDQLCTLALTEVGYEVDVAFGGDLPAEITIVHDDATGRKTAATESLSADPAAFSGG